MIRAIHESNGELSYFVPNIQASAAALPPDDNAPHPLVAVSRPDHVSQRRDPAGAISYALEVGE